MTKASLTDQIQRKQSYLCVGLDSDIDKLPPHLLNSPEPQFEFNRQIIDATRDYCVAYKINTAFYESRGLEGWQELEKTVRYIPSTHLKIADAKRGDIGNTAAQYAKAFFDTLGFDAVTVAPYMGFDSVQPFLGYRDKWTIVLGLTSNPGAKDFELLPTPDGLLYEQVLRKTAAWGEPGNLMFVIGATRPEVMASVRADFPDHFFLVPGVGAQGGSLEAISASGMNPECGLLVNASRAVIFASAKEDFATQAGQVCERYRDEMSRHLLRYR